jgi:hypothetical protein
VTARFPLGWNLKADEIHTQRQRSAAGSCEPNRRDRIAV